MTETPAPISPIVRRYLRRRKPRVKRNYRIPMMVAAVLAMVAGAFAYFHARPKEPSGDVVAIVNGIEITSAIVEAEARAAGLPLSGPDAIANRNMLLDRSVQRALLVAEANRRNLSRDPNFFVEREIVEQNMLAQRALGSAIDQQPKIPENSVNRYMNDNPHMFAHRQAIRVDQIRFRTDALNPSELRDLHSLSDVSAYLEREKIPFERSQPTLDGAVLPKELVNKLTLAKGEPSYYSIGDTTYINILLGLAPNPWTAEEQQAVARRALVANERLRQTQQFVENLRRSARIAYQPGYKPH